MTTAKHSLRYQVHRHIGGLENQRRESLRHWQVHRHIGGLENFVKYMQALGYVHRHIGGLEMTRKSL